MERRFPALPAVLACAIALAVSPANACSDGERARLAGTGIPAAEIAARCAAPGAAAAPTAENRRKAVALFREAFNDVQAGRLDAARRKFEEGLRFDPTDAQARQHLERIGQRRQGLEQALAARPPGTTFRDCPDCPEMVVVPAGTFVMGTPDQSPDERPQHRVILALPLAVGKTEVTQADWVAVMGFNPSQFRGERNPVDSISWDEAQAFVAALNAKVRRALPRLVQAGGPYRLLSEAEWEYAAGGGGSAAGPAQELCRLANVADQTYLDKGIDPSAATAACRDGYAYVAAVGSFPPNGFGLYDMAGNVAEWTADCYAGNYFEAPADGRAANERPLCSRVVRGGSFRLSPHYSRPSSRMKIAPETRRADVGLRLARTLP